MASDIGLYCIGRGMNVTNTPTNIQALSGSGAEHIVQKNLLKTKDKEELLAWLITKLPRSF